jgi:hypothetical protein
MGEKLLRFYKYVDEKAGLEGKMKLAVETKIPTIKASIEPDSPENLARFAAAILKITGAPPPASL